MSRPARGPRWWLLLAATVAFAALTFSLGRWQLARAAEKESLAAAIAARQHLPALAGRTLAAATHGAPAPEWLHRSVELRGQWLAAHTVYLDNRQWQGRSGFYVLTPLRLAGPGAEAVVLVLRGWAPRNFVQREALPAVQTPAGEVLLTGRIAERPPRLYALGDEPRGAIRQNLDLDAFRSETGLPLASAIVWQTGAPTDGLQRGWPEANSGVDKHYGYALQWFGLCALIAILFIWFQVVRPLYRSPKA